jgi:uncharacterized membrane protein YcaP (DUF421 family)
VDIPWSEMFVPDRPLLETFLRGTITYFSILILLRAILKREAGTIGMADMLLIVLIADAAQNAMAGEYHSITNGVLLVGTLILWNFVVDWLAFRYKFIDGLLSPAPLKLIHNGRALRKNMRREFITDDELLEAVRENGIEKISDVKFAYMESDGKISVVGREKHSAGKSSEDKGV